MKKKYLYNPLTCTYEPYRAGKNQLILRSALYFITSFFLSIGALYIYVQNTDSPDELILKQKNTKLRAQWEILQERVEKSQEELAVLIDRDDHNYRVILDTPPLDPAVRDAGIGGTLRVDYDELRDMPDVTNLYKRFEKLKTQLEIEKQSYQQLHKLLTKKMAIWSSRPAIQPINNKELTRLHTTFGMRNHPGGFVRDHKGLDFTADIGTPVYATGDAVVKMAYYSGSYGNVIYLDHAHGYETRYAHLSRFNVRPGQRVSRGQVIGYVGNTGLSFGPHLHYEVLYKGEQINPINFFQQDLSNKEFEKLVEIGSRQNRPLD